ncbi:MAG: excalibur calcium-binding domain-containing protein [Chloroflexota bacterium]|nr:excalibur calcium-binding domain-containing protein [Chloroflexota bacterium]MDE2883690.1 excalibur calcium-binding domain-containing protein [Chloroflexota bacterium]
MLLAACGTTSATPDGGTTRTASPPDRVPASAATPTTGATTSPLPSPTTPATLSPTQADVSASPTPSPTPGQAPLAAQDSPGAWRGLTVAPERRCSPYDPDDYRYSQSVEPHIVEDMGGIVYGPYTGSWFASTSDTDIEHIIARSEAHDSGLCAADAATRTRFSSDLLNLTLASPAANRSQKGGKDAAEWVPDLNRCWFANRVVEVRQRYVLTVDRRERDALENILSGCASTGMMIVERAGGLGTATPEPSAGGAADSDALRLYDDNGNGRITCAEARAHGIAPVHRSHPAYRHMHDGDGDGVVCE